MGKFSKLPNINDRFPHIVKDINRFYFIFKFISSMLVAKFE
jgi:hypothetical protein